MMQFTYLISLIATLTALIAIDWRYKLALFHDISRSVKTIFTGVVIFTIWDLLGIHFGIFFSGHSAYASQWFLVPNFPLEELFFLTMLCYLTLLLYQALERKT